MIESSRHVKTVVPGKRYWLCASTPYFTASLLTCRAGNTRSSSSRLTRLVAMDTPAEGFHRSIVSLYCSLRLPLSTTMGFNPWCSGRHVAGVAHGTRRLNRGPPRGFSRHLYPLPLAGE